MGRHNFAWAYTLVPFVAATAAAALAVGDPFRASLGLVRGLGVVPLFAGLGLVGWTVSTVRQAGETLSPVVEPGRLLTVGAFARTRNPMYLGVVTTTTGVSVLAASPAVAGYTGLLWLVYHLLVVFVEEPALHDQFGEEFDRYCADVSRWWPRPG